MRYLPIPSIPLLACLAACLAPGSVSAETTDSEETTDSSETATSTETKSQLGGYFRVELGCGYPWVHESRELDDSKRPTIHHTSAGAGPSAGLFLGRRLTSGYSAGVALMSTFARNPRYHEEYQATYLLGSEFDFDVSFVDNLSVGVVAGFSGVLHPDDGIEALGIGGSGSVRYNWQVGEGWSIGLVGRLTFTAMIADLGHEGSSTRTSVDPGILFNVTCF